MNDLISRQAVIDLCSELQGTASSREEMQAISKLWKKVKAMPTAYDLEKVLENLEAYAEEGLNGKNLINRPNVYKCIKIVEQGLEK